MAQEIIEFGTQFSTHGISIYASNGQQMVQRISFAFYLTLFWMGIILPRMDVDSMSNFNDKEVELVDNGVGCRRIFVATIFAAEGD